MAGMKELDLGFDMRQMTSLLSIGTERQGLLEITTQISEWTAAQSVTVGLLTIFCRHTSASLLIQENAAAAVRRDLEAYFARMAPEDPSAYEHDDEGPDDMPAHIRTALTQVQLSIPIIQRRLTLGTWQGIYLFEHRRRPQSRTLALHLLGE
jgi:secondary thiamine-phosphate synthase enzyme